MLQQLKAVFTFGVRKGYCFSNPALNILAEDYYKFCDLSTRANEERSFSDEEIKMLSAYCIKDRKNPHAAMMLVAIETGMRVGELAALKKIDIDGNYIREGMFGRPKYYIDGDLIRENNQFGRVVDMLNY